MDHKWALNKKHKLRSHKINYLVQNSKESKIKKKLAQTEKFVTKDRHGNFMKNIKEFH